MAEPPSIEYDEMGGGTPVLTGIMWPKTDTPIPGKRLGKKRRELVVN